MTKDEAQDLRDRAMHDMKAVAMLRHAAEAGDVYGQYFFGSIYHRGYGVAKDEQVAISWCLKAAEQGLAEAQCVLGRQYQIGEGVTQDHKEAVAWYRKAAEQGHLLSQRTIGQCYKRGEGVSQDYAEAHSWFSKAAAQGDAEAQHLLGLMYANGQGVTPKMSEAAIWFRKAAENGHATAQFYSGLLYLHGDGVAQDCHEAVVWLRRAAEQGVSRAQYELGSMYAHGRGIEQDFSQAAVWFRKAAQQELAPAQQVLAVMYANGQGVPQDLDEAIALFSQHLAHVKEAFQRDRESVNALMGAPPIPPGIAAPDTFLYIHYKAFRYSAMGAEQYREEDGLRQPPSNLPSSELQMLRRGCEQIVQWRGISPDLPLEDIGVAGFYALMRLFHFTVKKQCVSRTGDATVTEEMELQHSVTGEAMTLFNRARFYPISLRGSDSCDVNQMNKLVEIRASMNGCFDAVWRKECLFRYVYWLEHREHPPFNLVESRTNNEIADELALWQGLRNRGVGDETAELELTALLERKFGHSFAEVLERGTSPQLAAAGLPIWHAATGSLLPQRIGYCLLNNVTDYQLRNIGLGHSYAYNQPDGRETVTVYLYHKGEEQLVSGLEDERMHSEMQASWHEVCALAKLNEQDIQDPLGPVVSTLKAHNDMECDELVLAFKRASRNDGTTWGAISICGFRGHFLKIRTTTEIPFADSDEGEESGQRINTDIADFITHYR